MYSSDPLENENSRRVFPPMESGVSGIDRRDLRKALMIRAVARLAMAGAVLLAACRTTHPPITETSPAFSSVKIGEMEQRIHGVISSNQIPGCVLWMERRGSRYVGAYGSRALVPVGEPMTVDTVFDAASLTKVIATAPSVGLLMERGSVELDAPVQRYLPEFGQNGKEAVTIRHLLTHSSGLRPGIGGSGWSGYEMGIEKACAEKLVNPAGTTFRYSDINFIVLGEVVRRVSGLSLDQFAAENVFRPLRMDATGFLPGSDQIARIAPTQEVEGTVLRGVVHDPTSRRMGGVAGHAGLFTTAGDLARFCRMQLNRGTLDGVRVFRPETIELMSSVQSPEAIRSRRGLGWDIDTGYSRPRGRVFPLGSYGHTGFTGTSLWIDPFSETFWILMSNRVHPDGKGNVLPLQAALATMVGEAVSGFNFAWVAGALPPLPETVDANPKPVGAKALISADVSNGIDVLVQEEFGSLRGLRVGLVTNQTGTDRSRNSTIDLLMRAPGVRLTSLFSPEHGIRGVIDEQVPDGVDAATGLKIHSLYGEFRAPQPEQLKDLDVLVFDIQSIGCRFYTYISTLGKCLQAAAAANLRVIVLDRVNPINGIVVDGPVLSGATSFTGFHPIPVRHGMTLGELARMFNAELGLKAKLEVVPVKGWSRELWYDATGLPWMNPSPNMRSLTQAALYPGIGLLETTHLSVGRGTDTPFEIVGAPYIDDVKLAAELNRLGLDGVRFVPVRFTPTSSVFKGEVCAGVNIVLINRETCSVLDVGISMAATLHRLYPGRFGLEKFDRLLVHPATVEAIRAGQSLDEIRGLWSGDLDAFMKRRAAFLLY
jgi:uncharacterized protein YbbC (DUF1343 family)/CubicO group peptidase (beta-lactamase class C family)